jgi:hypothetical protein
LSPRSNFNQPGSGHGTGRISQFSPRRDRKGDTSITPIDGGFSFKPDPDSVFTGRRSNNRPALKKNTVLPIDMRLKANSESKQRANNVVNYDTVIQRRKEKRRTKVNRRFDFEFEEDAAFLDPKLFYAGFKEVLKNINLRVEPG